MFRKFKELTISKNCITIEYPNKTLEYRFPDKELDFDIKKGNQHFLSQQTNNSVVVLSGRIVCYDTNGKMETIQCPKEVLYYIQKDIRTKGMFVLSYRKHLIWKYDKRHVRVHFMPGCFEAIKAKSDLIKEVYGLVAEDYGYSCEFMPIIVFSPKGNTSLNYIVVHNYDVVMRGAL